MNLIQWKTHFQRRTRKNGKRIYFHIQLSALYGQRFVDHNRYVGLTETIAPKLEAHKSLYLL